MSSRELELRTNKFLNDLLLDVPILRAQGTAKDYLTALERAILFHPVFPNWPTPMDDWLVEAAQLSSDLCILDTQATIMLRRAVVHMRRLEYDAALAELEGVCNFLPQLSPENLAWCKITIARILTRKHQFDEARQTLGEVVSPPVPSWIAPLLIVARGEFQLEKNEIDLAENTLQQALTELPDDLVEERIQVVQSLGFVYITKANAPRALQYLDEARQMLRGAGAWIELIQMNLAVGSLLVAAGEQAAAQVLLAETDELSKQYPQPQLETLLHLMMARSKGAEGRIDDALAAVSQAAQLYARQGNVVGYVSMLVFMANLLIQNKSYSEAYRILATGVAVAKQCGWIAVQNVLRVHINRLRDDIMGPIQFDNMVQEMIQTMKMR